MALITALGMAACHPPPPATTPTPSMTSNQAGASVLRGIEASTVSFERIASFPPPGWQIPRKVHFSPDGKLVTYLRSEQSGDRMALFAFDVATGEHRVLVRAADLVDPSKPMSREEELRRERQRQRIRGVTGYAWAKHKPVMLLPLGGDVFVRLEDGSIKALTSSPEPEIDPKLCADGTQVAFSRKGELYTIAVADGNETQLTHDAEPGVTRGQSDFNGQEEFGEPSGLWWSPDCNRIAYLEVDERHVREVPVMGYRGDADLQKLRYPRAGDPNPKVRLGVVDLQSAKTTWIDMPKGANIDPDDQYLGRLKWSRDGSALFFQRLSRNQRHLALVRSDPTTGESQHIVEESDETWTELSPMAPLANGELLWTAWRDGHRHIERRNAQGGNAKSLTAGAWDVFDLVGVDEERARVLFVGNKDAVLDRQLYAVPLGGGDIVRLSALGGQHEVRADNATQGWVDVHSALDRIPRAELFDGNGKTLGAIPVPKDDDLDALRLRTPQRIEVPLPDGPVLHGLLLEPRDRQPGVRYPAILMVYGGPGVQVIQNEWNPRLLWQHLADRGFVILQIDNRGAKGRGHAFESPIYENLGHVELSDQLRALDYLSQLDYVDGERVGIYGHSYGGYMAAMAMMRAPGRFKVGVSGSPVTDWRFYDTGYTERFMGTPEGNPDGYAKSEIAQDAAGLAGKLFIIHALMDENVHFAHTAVLVDALVAADKDFDLLVFPGERHGYRSPKARRYAYRRVVDYFIENL